MTVAGILAFASSQDRLEGPNPYGALTTWPVVLVAIGLLSLLSWWMTRSSRSRR